MTFNARSAADVFAYQHIERRGAITERVGEAARKRLIEDTSSVFQFSVMLRQSMGSMLNTYSWPCTNGSESSKFSNDTPPGMGEELAQYAARPLTRTSSPGLGSAARQPWTARSPTYFQCSCVSAAYSAVVGCCSSVVAA